MGNWFSWLSSNSTNFEKDFDDIIKGLEINKETLTKENIIDKVFEAIWDDKEYPEKNLTDDKKKSSSGIRVGSEPDYILGSIDCIGLSAQ